MDGQPSAGGNLMQGWVYGCPDLQGSMQLQQEKRPCMSQNPAFDLVDNERQESMVIEDDVTNYAEHGKLEHNEVGKSEDGSPWQRMKWTGKMVKLLITILSYIGEDPSTDFVASQRKMSALLRKLGKWRCVSKAMVERGYHVSPQQCEDKFNNLNKTYRRLNDLLGRGTSCKVVENPKLLDIIDISEKGKEDVRKILTSKHLFFEEMCSYHNGNRLFLPHDPDLLQSLLLILKNEDDNKDDNELHDLSQPVLGGTNPKTGVLVEVDTAEDNGATSGFPEYSPKWLRLINENKIAGFGNTLKPSDSNQTFDAQYDTGLGNPLKPWDCNQILDAQPQYNLSLQNLSCHEGNEADGSQKQWMAYHLYRLEKQKLQLRSMVLDLEKQWFKWQRYSRKQDLKLDKLRLENKCLKLGNQYVATQLKRRRMELENQ